MKPSQTLTPFALAESVADYLSGNGWYRDGDDPGIWIPPESKAGEGGMTLGDAMMIQFGKDHVDWPDT